MEDITDGQMAVKVEKHSQYVILTYFQGDINSMVDAHFSRALSKVCQAKAPAEKPRKKSKTIKTEDSSPCQGSSVDPCSESLQPPVGGRLMTFNPTGNSPDWHSFTRAGEGPGLPYTLSQEGLSLTGQQYATSLLNLLHNDRGDLGPTMASSSKPEMLPSWTVPQGFRESVDPALGYETGRHLEKKDLYWY
ncbi:transcription cofactor vestigial-like protein 1 [Xyrichtys novacula]|uniref:Transcription cofactor vestigial-like protein 1 n=1 Tax=Xyrichtys novacula TaxID=13765 RepID=A0AAV1FCD6_XYRNO|nr:transcription cofactor vestigial-like protein 1 [Xyrichtys novacula]